VETGTLSTQCPWSWAVPSPSSSRGSSQPTPETTSPSPSAPLRSRFTTLHLRCRTKPKPISRMMMITSIWGLPWLPTRPHLEVGRATLWGKASSLSSTPQELRGRGLDNPGSSRKSLGKPLGMKGWVTYLKTAPIGLQSSLERTEWSRKQARAPKYRHMKTTTRQHLPEVAMLLRALNITLSQWLGSQSWTQIDLTEWWRAKKLMIKLRLKTSRWWRNRSTSYKIRGRE
jgi:hypothetical protein